MKIAMMPYDAILQPPALPQELAELRTANFLPEISKASAAEGIS